MIELTDDQIEYFSKIMADKISSKIKTELVSDESSGSLVLNIKRNTDYTQGVIDTIEALKEISNI